MSVAEAHEAKQTYLTQRKKFRNGLQRERLQAGKGSTFKDNDYSGGPHPNITYYDGGFIVPPQTWAKLP